MGRFTFATKRDIEAQQSVRYETLQLVRALPDVQMRPASTVQCLPAILLSRRYERRIHLRDVPARPDSGRAVRALDARPKIRSTLQKEDETRLLVNDSRYDICHVIIRVHRDLLDRRLHRKPISRSGSGRHARQEMFPKSPTGMTSAARGPGNCGRKMGGFFKTGRIGI